MYFQQNVLGIRESISLLNSDIARMTSLAVIRFGEMFIIGSYTLILDTSTSSQWYCSSVTYFQSKYILLLRLLPKSPLDIQILCFFSS